MVGDRSARARSLLDARFAQMGEESALLAVPPRGWIRTIRQALGMSQAAMATRLGVHQKTVHAMEISEAEGRIQLDTLRRAAEALECDLVYALVPRRPLHTTIAARRRAVAAAHVDAVDHTMALENQLPGDREARVEALTRQLSTSSSELWAGPAEASGAE